MPCLLEVFDTTLVSPPSYILDDVPLCEGDAIGMDVLNRLNRVVSVVVP